MVSDRQVRKLFESFEQGLSLSASAARAGMDEKTARHYRAEWKLPSQLRKDRYWRTREDPFGDVWGKISEKLELAPDLQGKTVLCWLMEQYPGRFYSGQLRTLQRHIKMWRALSGPAKEVFFPQIHHPGKRSQSDFTHMSDIDVTIAGQPFLHMCFHFVFTYSNWEDASICYSESYESLSFGLQNAWFRAGGVASEHQSDQMSAAVNKDVNPERFTVSYRALLRHYGTTPRVIQAGKANENGDVEKSHDCFKEAVRQELLLRSSRDFGSIEEYEAFLRKILDYRNAQRQQRFMEEQAHLRPLPATRLDDCKRFDARVSRASTVVIQHNTYSVHSRLVGEMVYVRLYANQIEVWYAQKCIEKLPRLRGTGKHHIQYRHIIDWLVRKPGAFEDYRYKADLFPTSYFRMAYDRLKDDTPLRASREYLRILELAAKESETGVNEVLKSLISSGQPFSSVAVREMLLSKTHQMSPVTEVCVHPVDLSDYDSLFENKMEVIDERYIEICAFGGAQGASPADSQGML